ncbi:hypothetical protein LKI_05435 [Leuconostoc kimchii IMSNU 11154]|uniref:Uncharacterized protein n=1 Tax=Leuconostoc kimchii (strain IMSNU 11154 / KCTC 2386 / IH25) TaxID=762051 RepID=D5T2X9_LEUKI|nr:hypothetical protein LKI_05435 [Leuconostoc kimchii IMSNU 11154]
MLPDSKNTTRSATCLANPISWVTMIMVIPVPAKFFITSRTSPTISGSKAEVGSSNSITSGDIAKARAIAIRCFCPPDKEFTDTSALSAKLTTSSNSRAFFSAAVLSIFPSSTGANIIFSNTV